MGAFPILAIYRSEQILGGLGSNQSKSPILLKIKNVDKEVRVCYYTHIINNNSTIEDDMIIYPFEKTSSDVFGQPELGQIIANGINVRCGNKVLRLSVTEEIAIPDQESLRNEMKIQFREEVDTLKSKFDEYKAQMRLSLNEEKEKLKRSQQELDRRLAATQTLPALRESHMQSGLSVCIADGGGLMWSFKTVYAPKWVGARRIEPEYSKRLVTPITINVFTNKDCKVHQIVVRQYMGTQKFTHYHSTGANSDCWGAFKYSGVLLTTPEEVIEFCKRASFVLEVINDASIANRNPRGLSRFDTLTKHLLPQDAEGEVAAGIRTNATNSRNERSGVTADTNQDVSDSVWST